MRKKKLGGTEEKIQLLKELQAGSLSLADTVRRLRKIVGKNQEDYARWVQIAPRALIDRERGVGNPTLKTLEKICAPFGLKLGLFSEKTDT